MGDNAGAGPAVGDAATGPGGVFRGCSSGCAGNEAGLGKAAEAGVCAAGDEDASADSCAFALSVRSREVAITQCQVRITQPRFRFCFLQQFESSGSAALVFVTRRLLVLGRAQVSYRLGVCFPNVGVAILMPNVERRGNLV